MCRNCLIEMIGRMKEIDTFVLIALRETSALYGMVVQDVVDEIDRKPNRVYESLSKMCFVGAVDYVMEDRFYKYYITDTGQEILEILNEM